MNTITNTIYGMLSRGGYITSTLLTRFPTVIYGIHGLRRVQPRKDGGLLSTLAFPYWGLIGVGVLSAWFHATLKYHSQMGDDLSMFLAVGTLLHQLLCFEATQAQRIKYTVAVLGTLIPVSVYHVWADEIYVHEIVFAIYVYLVSRKARQLIKRQIKSEEGKKRLGNLATFGVCMWIAHPLNESMLIITQHPEFSATSSGPLTSICANTSRLSSTRSVFPGAFSSSFMVGGISSQVSVRMWAWQSLSTLSPLRTAKLIVSRRALCGPSKPS